METFVPLACPDLSGNELKYLTECVQTGYVTHAGRFEKDFEKAFSKRFDTPAIATSSGTGALHLALLAAGIGVGDEVVVPALTFGATASAVLAVGARPIVVDVDGETWGLDRRGVLRALTRKTRAILPVHLYGEDAGDFKQFGLTVIEDACEALGLAPIRGDMACYSFYGNKPMTTGEGGMLCGAFKQASLWRDGGFDEGYRNILPGLNYRMSNMQAAVGLAQLERFDQMLEARLANVGVYRENLKGRGKWLFCVETPDPVGLSAFLKEKGVDTRPIFMPLHRSPAFAPYCKSKYRVADWIWENHLTLPTGPHVSTEKAKTISEWCNEHFDLCRAANSGRKLAVAG